MPKRTYAVAFNINLRDGSTLRITPGQQEVPDEVAENKIAQFNEVDPPESVIQGYEPPFGMPGHHQYHFMRNRGVAVEDMPLDQMAKMARQHQGAFERVALTEDRSSPVAEGTVQDGRIRNENPNFTSDHMKVAAGDTTDNDASSAASQANDAALKNAQTEAAARKKEEEDRAMAEHNQREQEKRDEIKAQKEAGERSDEARKKAQEQQKEEVRQEQDAKNEEGGDTGRPSGGARRR